MCGIGILSVPYAIKQGGWMSLLPLILLGVISCYTGILIKRCLDSSLSLETYLDVGQAAFGLAGRIWFSVSCVVLHKVYFLKYGTFSSSSDLSIFFVLFFVGNSVC